MALSSLAYNACAFVAGLFLLEWGADSFVDHSVAVAKRLGVSPTLVSLLTAGGEWEELAVVIAAVSQQRSNLALGNVVGSSISNILGAFALGLIFHPASKVCFDRSAKIYTSVLVFITTLFTAFLAFYRPVKDVAGPVLLFAFVLYVGSIFYGIYWGVVSPPEDSDSDSDGPDSDADADSDSDNESDASTLHDVQPPDGQQLALLKSARSSVDSDVEPAVEPAVEPDKPPAKAPRKPKKAPAAKKKTAANNKRPKSVGHHVAKLLVGFLALTVSCYVLSRSIGNVGDALNMSSTVLGITLLSLATTLPEKMVAVVGGARGQGGIVIANTVGSNIFLMTLCAGVLFVSGDKEKLAQGVNAGELVIMWLTSAVLCVCVFVGTNRRVGYLLLGLYVVFLVVEFAVMHKRDLD